VEIEAVEGAIRIEKSNVRIALNTLALLKTSESMRTLDWQVCVSLPSPFLYTASAACSHAHVLVPTLL
jgi:hypothetical protein